MDQWLGLLLPIFFTIVWRVHADIERIERNTDQTINQANQK